MMFKSKKITIEKYRIDGYTLIELLVVISIISIFLFIALPRFSLSGRLQTSSGFVRNLQKKLEYLLEKSILEKKVYIFNLDGEEGIFNFTVSEEGNPEGKINDRFLKQGNLPSDLRLIKIDVVPGGRLVENKISVVFTPTGMMFSFRLYFESGDNTWVLEGIRPVNRVVYRKLTKDEKIILGLL